MSGGGVKRTELKSFGSRSYEPGAGLRLWIPSVVDQVGHHSKLGTVRSRSKHGSTYARTGL